MVNTGSSNSALRDNTNQRLSILKYVYLLLAEVLGVARGVKKRTEKIRSKKIYDLRKKYFDFFCLCYPHGT